MSKLIIAVALVVCCIACNNDRQAGSREEKETSTSMHDVATQANSPGEKRVNNGDTIAADRGPNIRSRICQADQVWSDARNDCIKPGDPAISITLKAVNPPIENVYVVFSADSSLAEVFWGSDKKLLRQITGSTSWELNDLELKKTSVYRLSMKGKLMYEK